MATASTSKLAAVIATAASLLGEGVGDADEELDELLLLDPLLELLPQPAATRTTPAAPVPARNVRRSTDCVATR
ncbi:MAG: hypothetical protein NVSMB29_15860 [Candidatus Dormibacteria bacterium]